MDDDNITLFPGETGIIDHPLTEELKEASREAERHGFTRKCKGLFAFRRIPVNAQDEELERADFLDRTLLMARVLHHRGEPWPDAFRAVVGRVTVWPKPERGEAIHKLEWECNLYRYSMLSEIAGRVFDDRKFRKSLAEHLGVKVDILPHSSTPWPDWRHQV